MKKYRIKLVALFVAVALMLPSFTSAGALMENEVDDGLLTEEEAMNLLERQAPAMDEHKRITNLWAKIYEPKGYPDSFGGFYIDENNVLVICILGNDVKIKEEVNNAVEDKSIVRFESTDVTLDDLYEIQAKLPELLPNCTIVESGISIKNSCVNVGIQGNDAAAYNMGTYDSIPHVSVKIADHTYKGTATNAPIEHNPGNTITAGGATGTLGWYGKYHFGNDELYPCFVTAGHVIYMFYDNPMYFGSNMVYNAGYDSTHCEVVLGTGKVSDGKPRGSSDGDYAFIEYNSVSEQPLSGCKIVNPTKKVQIGVTTQQITDYFGQELYDGNGGYSIRKDTYNVDLLPENLLVMKGKGVGEYSAGRIKESNWSYSCLFDNDTVTDYTVKHMLQVEPSTGYSQFVEPGDSGGPVFYGTGTGYTLLGIVQGARDDDGYAGVTPLTILLSAGFVPYPWCDQ